eukprot:g46871.t1
MKATMNSIYKVKEGELQRFFTQGTQYLWLCVPQNTAFENWKKTVDLCLSCEAVIMGNLIMNPVDPQGEPKAQAPNAINASDAPDFSSPSDLYPSDKPRYTNSNSNSKRRSISKTPKSPRREKSGVREEQLNRQNSHSQSRSRSHRRTRSHYRSCDDDDLTAQRRVATSKRNLAIGNNRRKTKMSLDVRPSMGPRASTGAIDTMLLSQATDVWNNLSLSRRRKALDNSVGHGGKPQHVAEELERRAKAYIDIQLDQEGNETSPFAHFSVRSQQGHIPLVEKPNQDRAVAICPFMDLPGRAFFAVCDGHGPNGHLVSSYVSQHLPLLFAHELRQNAHSVKDAGVAAYKQCNTKLMLTDIDLEFSGCTAVVVLLDKDKLYAFNVGDSRAVLARRAREKRRASLEKKEGSTGWEATALSYDHKPFYEEEKKRIEAAGGRCEPPLLNDDVLNTRVWLKDLQIPGLAVSRAFGDTVGRKVGVDANPDYLELSLDAANRAKFFILASDGIWEFMSNIDVVTWASENDTSADACIDLISEATAIWAEEDESRDDITLIVVFLHGYAPGEEDAADSGAAEPPVLETVERQQHQPDLNGTLPRLPTLPNAPLQPDLHGTLDRLPTLPNAPLHQEEDGTPSHARSRSLDARTKPHGSSSGSDGEGGGEGGGGEYNAKIGTPSKLERDSDGADVNNADNASPEHQTRELVSMQQTSINSDALDRLVVN